MPLSICLRVFALPLVVVAFQVAVPAHDHSTNGDQEISENRFTTTRETALAVPVAKQEEAFQFLIYGDRTGGVPEGLSILEQAVTDTNLLDPDFVMTVGDLIQGYNETPEWIEQMKRPSGYFYKHEQSTSDQKLKQTVPDQQKQVGSQQIYSYEA